MVKLKVKACLSQEWKRVLLYSLVTHVLSWVKRLQVAHFSSLPRSLASKIKSVPIIIKSAQLCSSQQSFR
jgi:hypothetical protein